MAKIQIKVLPYILIATPAPDSYKHLSYVRTISPSDLNQHNIDHIRGCIFDKLLIEDCFSQLTNKGLGLLINLEAMLRKSNYTFI